MVETIPSARIWEFRAIDTRDQKCLEALLAYGEYLKDSPLEYQDYAE
jgi:hypothetical protein